MKNLFKCLLVCVLVFFYSESFCQQPIRANDIIADKNLYPPAGDTILNPGRVGDIRFRIADSSLYTAVCMTCPKKWERIAKYSQVGSGDFVPISDSVTDGNPTGYVKGKDIMGNVVSTAFASASGFTTVTGAATISYSSGLNISGGNGNFDNNYVKSNFVSLSNNYIDTMEFTINTKPSTQAGGLTLIKQGQLKLYVRMKMTTADSCKAEMRVVNGSGNGSPFDSTTNISMADGGAYRMIASQSNNTILFSISRIVGGLETETKSKMFIVPVNTYFQLPNLGSVGVSVLGGDYKVTKLQQTSYDIKGADALLIATSIGQGPYAPTSIENHYLKKAFEGSGFSYVGYGSAGSQFVNFIDGLPAVYASEAKRIIIELGVNDVCANLRLYSTAYIDSLFLHGYTGKDILWIKNFNDACKDTIIANICREKGITLADPWVHMTADMFQDGVHPNDKGNVFIAQFIKAKAPQFFGSTGNIDQISLAGLKDVYLNGAVTSDVLSFNSVTNKWNNTSLTGTGSFINNNATSTPQAASGFINGSFSANGSIGIGAQTDAAAKLQIFEADNSGTGITIRNNNAASSATKVIQIKTNGGSAAEGADFNNSGSIEAVTSGGLFLSAYDNAGGIKFGITRTAKMWFNNTGLGIGVTPDSLLTVNTGAWVKRGVRFSGLPSSPTSAADLMMVQDTVTGVVSHRAIPAGGSGMSNPMTTTGDLISSTGSTPIRLGIGSTNDVLTVIGGVPVWQAPTGGGTPPGSNTHIIYNNAGAFGANANFITDGAGSVAINVPGIVAANVLAIRSLNNTPEKGLIVNSNTGSTYTQYGISTINSSNVLIIDAPAGVSFQSGAVVKATLTSAGSLFLGGTTTPTEVLHVGGNVRFSGALMPNNNAGTAGQPLISGGPGGPNTWGSAGVTTIQGYSVDQSNSGTGETDLHSLTIPANKLANTDESAYGNFSGTFNDVTATGQLKIIINNNSNLTTIFNSGTLTISATGGWNINVNIQRTGSTTAKATVTASTPGASTSVYTTYTSITGLDYTFATVVKVTGQAGGGTGGTGDITGTMSKIYWSAAN